MFFKKKWYIQKNQFLREKIWIFTWSFHLKSTFSDLFSKKMNSLKIFFLHDEIICFVRIFFCDQVCICTNPRNRDVLVPHFVGEQGDLVPHFSGILFWSPHFLVPQFCVGPPLFRSHFPGPPLWQDCSRSGGPEFCLTFGTQDISSKQFLIWKSKVASIVLWRKKIACGAQITSCGQLVSKMQLQIKVLFFCHYNLSGCHPTAVILWWYRIPDIEQHELDLQWFTGI